MLLKFTLMIVACCFGSNFSLADTLSDFREAQRIVVVTESEGIHYGKFPAFCEIRELLADGVENTSGSIAMMGAPVFEVKILGRSGERTAYVGDHWISTDTGTALLTSKNYSRIIELVEMRIGSGVAKQKVGISVQQTLARIQDVAYVEEDDCKSQ